jgi:anti-anti-sigma regulatory factor
MSPFIKNIKESNQIVIIETDGYLNKEGGEAIAAICFEKIKAGQVNFLINMATTKVVNSIGVSILIEIIEKLQEVDGKIGYYNLAPIVSDSAPC